MTYLGLLEEVIKNARVVLNDIGLVKWMDTPLEDPEFDGLTPGEILGNSHERLLLEHTRKMAGDVEDPERHYNEWGWIG